MNTFSKQKKIFLVSIILMLLMSFFYGIYLFISPIKEGKPARASVDGVTITSQGSWSASSNVYSISKTGFSSGSYTMEFTATGNAALILKASVQKGTLVITNTTTGSVIYSASNTSTSTDITEFLDDGTFTFTVVATTDTGTFKQAKASVEIVGLTQEGLGTIEQGYGTSSYPYLIENEEDFDVVRSYPSHYYKLANDITMVNNFTPIGTSSVNFTGTLDGGGFTIYNLTVADQAYAAMFSYTNGGTIKDLYLENINVTGYTYVSFLIAYGAGGTIVDNVHINGTLNGRSEIIFNGRMGGILGSGMAKDCIKATNCTVSGTIDKGTESQTAFRVGGLTGDCGTFTNCTVYATVKGLVCVGGLVGGGYIPTGNTVTDGLNKFATSAIFNNCVMAGEVVQTYNHDCNYPYIGYINGYGAWLTLENNNTGVQLSVDYTTSKEVVEIGIFNSDNTVDDVTKGIVVTPTQTETGYNFSQFIPINQTYIGTSTSAMMDETSVVGITSNFGGFVVRFKMADGTYKYVSTLDQSNLTYRSHINVNLDELTSYVDNFANIEVNSSFGTGTYKTATANNRTVSVYGSAKITNNNDFEHLSWVVNGGIPTAFGTNTSSGEYFYNGRSIVTVGIDLQTDIDLTANRYARISNGVATLITEEEYIADSTNAIILNQNNSGEIIQNFYGFGIGEMMPYRGSIEGNNHNINVDINLPDAYMAGIVKVVTNDSGSITMQNFTVSGSIIGKGNVGPICIFDNHKRDATLYITNVTNNAYIEGKHIAAGIIAQPHSNAHTVLENCTNNGFIKAVGDSFTTGKAGGLVGDCGWYAVNSTLRTPITFRNCTNNGRVYADYYAGGFMARGSIVWVDGENINRGIVHNTLNNTSYISLFVRYYINGYTSYNPTDEQLTANGETVGDTIVNPNYTGYFKAVYTLDFACATEFSITATNASGEILFTSAEDSATTDTDTRTEVGFIDIAYTDFLNAKINILNPYLLVPIIINPKVDINSEEDIMVENVSMPIKIELCATNIYDVTTSVSEDDDDEYWTDFYSLDSSSDIWQLQAYVYFSNGKSTITIDLEPNIDTTTNQLTYIQVSFSDKAGLYKIPDNIVKTLTRITADVETFVINACKLVNAKSGTSTWFTNLGDKVYTSYNNLVSELSGYDAQTGYNGENIERFNNYIQNTIKNICNQAVSVEQLATYYNNIVKTADLSNITDVSVDYGVYEFTKTLTFTMVDGTDKTKTITYTFAKNGTLSAVASTSGVSFNVGEIVTYSYTSDLNVTINPIDLLDINFTNNEFIYDGTAKTITASISVLDGDSVEFTLSYNGEASAVDADTYEVVISSLSGDDAIFYNIPTEYTKGSLIIDPIVLSLVAENGKSYEYNKTAQATDFSISKLSTSTYEISESDYSVVYTNDNYSSSEKPVNAGSYTATINTNSNFTFSGANSFTFVITQKQITDVIFESEYEYISETPNFEFTNFEGVIEGDSVEVVTYTIYDSKGSVSDGVNVGNYTIQVNTISNGNYYIENLIKSFVINQANVSIKLNELTSVYGDALVLSELTFEITEGEVYEGDNLNVVASQLASNVAGAYPLTATYSNDNYNVSITNGTYTISQREMSIDYGTLSYDYSSQNLYSEISPVLSNVIEADLASFTFTLYSGEQATTEFKNAGTYLLKLNENDVTNNYVIEVKQQEYLINKYNLALTAKNLDKNYNQEILVSDFGVESVVLAGQDSLSDIVTIAYEVYLGESKVDYSVNLDVGTYTIKLFITAGDLYNNYNITTTNGTLTITEEGTYIVANDIEKFYDGEVVVFTAKLFGIENEELTDVEIVYTYYQDGQEVSEVKNVGNYTVNVKANAGENYAESEKIYNIVIKINVVTITLTNEQVTYSATQYVPDFTYAMNSQVDLSGILSYKLLDKNQEETTDVVDADDYYLQFALSDSNYQLQKSLFTIKINPIAVSITINDRDVVYGDEFDVQTSTFVITSGEILTGESLTLTYEVIDYQVVVKDYVLTATNSNTNYNVSITNGTLTISARELEVQYTGASKLEYNSEGYTNILSATVSNAKTDDVYSIYYLNANSQQVENLTDAGNYSLVVELIDTQNYVFKGSSQTLLTETIIVSKKAMSLTIDIESKVYDSQLILLNGVYCNDELVSQQIYSVEYYKDGSLTVQPEGVGNYTIKIVETDSKNYQFSNNSKDFVISSREVTIEPIEREYQYTRNAIKPELQLLNIVEGDNIKLSYTYVENEDGFKEVGTYTITINGLTGADSGNYTLVADNEISYDIVAVPIKVEVTNTSFTFTNKQLTKEQLELVFTGDLDVIESDYTISSLPTNVGTYQITFSGNNSGIDFDISSFEVVISRAEITGIELTDKTVTFNNKAHSLAVNTLTLASGVTVEVEYSENSFIDAGSYEISATLTNDNYTTKVLTATLTINQLVVTVEVTGSTSYTYNGKSQGLEILGFEDLWYKDLISYSYKGEGYSSIEKPVNAGDYSLEITSYNDDNISIVNTNNAFVINTKGITITSLQEQSFTYNAQENKFAVTYTGIVSPDEVTVEVEYNGGQNLPYNAGNYVVTFVGLSGQNAGSYHITNSTATASLKISPYAIRVVADDKNIIYGDENLPLTFKSDNLLAEDKFSGEISREAGNSVGSYIINQGTLTAGENYTITFVNGLYSIAQRPIYFADFGTTFVYNGNSQVPTVNFSNIATGDSDVVEVRTDGDTTNVGNYTLSIAVLNSNYKLSGKNSFNITITKKDVSDKIINLVTTNKDYDGKAFEPMVIIEDDFNYTLSYKLNGEDVEGIMDCGVYTVVVQLDEQNFQGEKSFEFTVNKVYYTDVIFENIEVIISSDNFEVVGLDNINIGIDYNDCTNGSKVEGLTEKTQYELFIEVAESTNYKKTILRVGLFTTSPSAQRINGEIDEIIAQGISISNLAGVKALLKDCQILSDSEQKILNLENLNSLKVKYQEYFAGLNEEIEDVKISSSIVRFDFARTIAAVSSVMSVLGYGVIKLKEMLGR